MMTTITKCMRSSVSNLFSVLGVTACLLVFTGPSEADEVGRNSRKQRECLEKEQV